jgi:hypothetical protein
MDLQPTLFEVLVERIGYVGILNELGAAIRADAQPPEDHEKHLLLAEAQTVVEAIAQS